MISRNSWARLSSSAKDFSAKPIMFANRLFKDGISKASELSKSEHVLGCPKVPAVGAKAASIRRDGQQLRFRRRHLQVRHGPAGK
jgi:hypothetical protein